MGAGRSGLFRGTKGSKNGRSKAFSSNGHVTLQSIRANREDFLGKSVSEVENMLQQNGYETKIRESVMRGSSAKIIEIKNKSKDRNISQVQVSSVSQRHGVPYVKISTTDIGKIKIVDAEQGTYKTDGKETATIIFRRNNYENK